MDVKEGLPAIANADARVVILGSLPGDRSLAAARYYAHPSNQFWRLVGVAIGESIAALDYGARLQCLGRHRIGLWDVIASASRDGSLDQAIRDAAHNPLADWLAGFPELRLVAFNGQAAAKAGRPLVGDRASTLVLPSSSAANTMPFADKARAWAAIAQGLA